MKEILESTHKKVEDLAGKARDGGMDLEAVRSEHMKLRKETEEALKALLTTEQAERLANATQRSDHPSPESK